MEIGFDWEMYLAAAKKLPDLALREGFYRLALQAAEKSCGEDSLAVAIVLMDLSDCLEAQGKMRLARKALKRAYSILRRHINRNQELKKRIANVGAHH